MATLEELKNALEQRSRDSKLAIEIINIYEKSGRKVDGMRLLNSYASRSESVKEIITEAQWRDIVVDPPPKWIYSRPWYKFEWEIDPDFSLDDLIKDIE